MPNYITALNQSIVAKVAATPGICVFGQNINTGTFITGLSRNLAVPPDGKIINTQNSENSLCGMGFGMMLSGARAVYFVKQLDFMLLGLDHFVNTYNFIRCSRDVGTLGSFTVLALVCDQGLQGPQSSFNSLGDFCSIARVPCYSVTNSRDAERVIGRELTAPGFRIVGLSSRLFKTEFMDLPLVHAADDGSVFQYTEGADATIVCFNFSLPHGRALEQSLAAQGRQASLFSVNYVPSPDWGAIRESVAKTGRIVILDDSKSVHLPAYHLLDQIAQSNRPYRRWVVARGSEIDFGMSTDEFRVDVGALAQQVVA